MKVRDEGTAHAEVGRKVSGVVKKGQGPRSLASGCERGEAGFELKGTSWLCSS